MSEDRSSLTVPHDLPGAARDASLLHFSTAAPGLVHAGVRERQSGVGRVGGVLHNTHWYHGSKEVYHRGTLVWGASVDQA
jgi:hypothetical protein